MASVYSATNEGAEALAAATAETVICLIGSTTVKPRICEWGVSFDGVVSTAATVRVRLVRTTADDGTSTAATEVAWDPDNPTANCAAKHSYTVEPTKAAVALVDVNVPPTSGLVIQYPLGREITVDNSASTGLALECTAPAIVNVLAWLSWEE